MSDWDTLGVPRNASKEQVKTAYRKLCLQHHPDLFQGQRRGEAEVRFRLISDAYNRLSSGQIGSQRPRSAGTPYRHTYRWSRLPQQRFTNGMVASALCVPLVLAGIYFASTGERTDDGFGRPNGMLQPPVNPFLADAWKAREHRSSLFRRSHGSSHGTSHSPVVQAAAATEPQNSLD